jgi:hypothetical protein
MKWESKKFICRDCDIRVCVAGHPALVDEHKEQADMELCIACFRAKDRQAAMVLEAS